MRKIVSWCIWVFVAVVAVGLVMDSDVSAAKWSSSTPKIISSKPYDPPIPSPTICNGVNQSITLSGGAGLIKACVFGGFDGFRFARYWQDQVGVKHAFAYPGNEVFYEVRGLCDNQHNCAYAQGTDSMVAKARIGNSGAVIHKQVSKQLKKRVDILQGRYYFSYEPHIPPFEVRSETHLPYVGAIAVSPNGVWAFIELPSYGFLRINLVTYEMRRVVAPGPSYGYGKDPVPQLAIANDGSAAVIAGERMGFTIVTIDETCGDALFPSMTSDFPPGSHPCVKNSPPFNSTHPGFYMAYSPTFIANDTRIATTVLAGNTFSATVIGYDDDPNELFSYVALGDSFTSGEGETHDEYYQHATNIGSHKCHVSKRAYPFLLGSLWGVSHANVACSGARTVDILGGAHYQGQGDRLKEIAHDSLEVVRSAARTQTIPGVIAQSEFIELSQPNTVTIGIGGNDAGLMGKLLACIRPFDTCEWAKDNKGRQATAQEISRIYPMLREVYRKVKESSPSSRVFAIGYPLIINADESGTCGPLLSLMLDKEERLFIHEALRYLNVVVRAAAEAEQVSYVDIEDALNGVRLCDNSDQPGMHAVRLGDDIAPFKTLPSMKLFGAESFHPTPEGHRRIAALISQQIVAPLQRREVRSAGIEPTYTSSYWGDEASDHAPYRQIAINPSLTYVMLRPQQAHEITTQQYVFMPNTTVNVSLDVDGWQTFTLQVDAEGRVRAPLAIDKDAPSGFYTLRIEGKGYMEDEPVLAYQTTRVVGNEDTVTAIAVDHAVYRALPVQTTHSTPMPSMPSQSVRATTTVASVGNLTALFSQQGVLPAFKTKPTTAKPHSLPVIYVLTVIGALLITLAIGIYHVRSIVQRRSLSKIERYNE